MRRTIEISLWKCRIVILSIFTSSPYLSTGGERRDATLLDVNLTVIKISLPRARSPPVVSTTWIYSSVPACLNLRSSERKSERRPSLNFLTRHLHFYEFGFNQYSADCFDVVVISTCLADYLPLTLDFCYYTISTLLKFETTW